MQPCSTMKYLILHHYNHSSSLSLSTSSSSPPLPSLSLSPLLPPLPHPLSHYPPPSLIIPLPSHPSLSLPPLLLPSHPPLSVCVCVCACAVLSNGISHSPCYRFMTRWGDWMWCRSKSHMLFNKKSQLPEGIVIYTWVVRYA